jgi:Ni,Fe-hydrogenase I cytochrome b subunit
VGQWPLINTVHTINRICASQYFLRLPQTSIHFQKSFTLLPVYIRLIPIRLRCQLLASACHKEYIVVSDYMLLLRDSEVIWEYIARFSHLEGEQPEARDDCV